MSEGTRESLARKMEWLYGEGGVYGGDGEQKCSCDYSWESMGRLHGVSMGKGWVRTSTDAECPFHGDDAD